MSASTSNTSSPKQPPKKSAKQNGLQNGAATNSPKQTGISKGRYMVRETQFNELRKNLESIVQETQEVKKEAVMLQLEGQKLAEEKAGLEELIDKISFDKKKKCPDVVHKLSTIIVQMSSSEEVPGTGIQMWCDQDDPETRRLLELVGGKRHDAKSCPNCMRKVEQIMDKKKQRRGSNVSASNGGVPLPVAVRIPRNNSSNALGGFTKSKPLHQNKK